MGRGFLSIKLAAVSVLLVLAAVTVEGRDRIREAKAAEALERAAWMETAVLPGVSAESAAVLIEKHSSESCGASDTIRLEVVQPVMRFAPGGRTVRS